MTDSESHPWAAVCLSAYCYLISGTMAVGRDPGLNIDALCTVVVMALGPTIPAGWTGRNTDILPVTAGHCTGNKK